MTPDVGRLIRFYKSPLGHVARRLVREQVRTMMGDVRGRRVLGLGFATPYLRSALGPAERVLSFMPARQGASSWPREGPSTTVLCDPLEMPLTDAAVDVVVAIHAFEHIADAEELMRELWRVCAPGADLVVVVPRRRGLWSTRDNTPFGAGHPYSRGQIEKLLREHSFRVESHSEALYLPPTDSRLVLRFARPIERLGRFFGPMLAGVVCIHAKKQMVPAIRRRLKAERFVRVPAMAPRTAMNAEAARQR